MVNGVVIHKDFHSTPDLKKDPLVDDSGNSDGENSLRAAVSQENIKNAKNKGDELFKNSDLSDAIFKLNGADERIGSQRGYFTLPSRHKRMAIDPEGNYRSVSKIRPVKLHGAVAAPPPPEHPPPPPPDENGGVEEVRSPGGTVRSSFKPSDNAKLYASPENVQSVAYREPDVRSSPKKRSPTARANSMPPKPSRPQVLRRSSASEAPPASTAIETYTVNGVNYTTYTTFRSPITPDEVDAPSFSNRQFETPVIPEPDYDMSEVEYRQQYHDGSRRGSRSNGTTLERKKKKTVSFVINEEVAAKLQAGKTRRQESILKDPNRDRAEPCQHSRPILNNPFAKDPEKYTQPIDRIPTAKLRFDTPHQTVAQHQQQHPAMAPEVEKIRIEVPPKVPNKVQLNRSNSTAESGSNTSKVTLQKSLSFCADKTKAVKISVPATTAVSHPTENEILRVRSQLKPSRSFPNELTNNKQDKAEEADNSSSGVSSDHENQAAKYVTYLPVDGGAASTLEVGSAAPKANQQPTQPWGVDNVSESGSDDVSSERSWVLRAEQDNLGRNIVYMKKMLHPKLQAIFDKQPTGQKGANNDSLVSSVSSNSSSSSLGHHHQYSSQTLPHRHHQQKSDERSISQSLALINQHVSSLGEVNNLAGILDTTSISSGAAAAAVSSASQPAVLAPPPGFSDSETFSDTDSFSSNGSQTRFKSGSKTIETIQSLNNQLKETSSNILMTRSMGPCYGNASEPLKVQSAAPTKNRVTFAKTIMSVSTSDFDSMPAKKQQGQKEFRNKPLIGWTTVDVCDWLDSLFMPEYKPAFIQNEIDGFKLASITKSELETMGVIRVGHMMNIEKSLKRYLTA